MDRTGLKIGTIRGIPIRVDVTFLIILPFIAFWASRALSDAAALADVPPAALRGSPLLWGFALAIALFISVLLHELAHSIYAIRHGGRVADITLLMFGGVSRIEALPTKVGQEAIMALVGPLTSIALGALFYAAHVLVPSTSFEARFGLFYLGVLNIFLGFFNLLPAFPMDGGRILRSLLARRMGLARATGVAASVGKGFAVLFAIAGVLTFNLMLLVISFVVFVGAEAERRAQIATQLIGKLQVRDVMTTDVIAIPPDFSVQDAADGMMREKRLAFVVTTDGAPYGLITAERIKKIPPEQRAKMLVGEAATPAATLASDTAAVQALRVMSETGAPQVAVVDEGRLVGILGRDDIERTLKLRELAEVEPWTAPLPASARERWGT